MDCSRDTHKFCRFTFLITIILMFLLCISNCLAAEKSILEYKINGLEDPALQNALDRLKLHQEKLSKSPTVKEIQEVFAEGPKEIHEAIKPFGFFRATVSRKQLRREGGKWIASYNVNPGSAIKVTTLNIAITGEGQNIPAFNKILAKLPLKINDDFNAKKYHKVVSILLTEAKRLGFLKAYFTVNQITINLNNYTCAINITLNTGARYYFGKIYFRKTPLEENLLRRYLNFKQNDYFSYDKLLKLQNSLSGSGYFSSVDVVPELKAAKNRRIPVYVNLAMNKRNQFRFGLGYATDSGARATVGYNRRWVNRYGHEFSAVAKVSQIEDSGIVRYIIPGEKPANTQYIISADINRIRPKNGDSVVGGLGIGQITRYSKWQRLISLNYEVERYKLYDWLPYQTSRLLIPSLSFVRRSYDNIVKINNGSLFSGTVRGAAKPLLSTVNFLQFDFHGGLVRTFMQDNRFILKGSFGYTFIKDENELPISKQFYAGGVETIRGYRYKHLGPGKYLVVGSLEYQHRVYKQFYGAIFYDIGNAYNDFDVALKQSAGAGVVWQSPIGPVRIYIAKALKDQDKPLRLELSVGNDL